RAALGGFSASSLHTLLEMVAGDLGVTFVPEMAVGSGLLRGTGVRTWPLREKSYREIALGWRETSARAQEFRQLGAMLQMPQRARADS
ncbi:MAG: LysR substrate-binding domain-containing protein, partial [Gammaproteobacteria bacterium]|nr:LysR substrate-binding domain-containing protein [Gammaproteobacteria bacterium]